MSSQLKLKGVIKLSLLMILKWTLKKATKLNRKLTISATSQKLRISTYRLKRVIKLLRVSRRMRSSRRMKMTTILRLRSSFERCRLRKRSQCLHPSRKRQKKRTGTAMACPLASYK
jgi:hypothetical protein